MEASLCARKEGALGLRSLKLLLRGKFQETKVMGLGGQVTLLRMEKLRPKMAGSREKSITVGSKKKGF